MSVGMSGRVRITRRRWFAVMAATGALLASTAVSVGLAPALAEAPAVPSAAADTSASGGGTLDDVHNIPTNAVAGDVTFLDNVQGVSGYSGLNFIHYAK